MKDLDLRRTPAREATTRRLLEDGWRPFPEGHTLPPWIPFKFAVTCGAYEGEPRGLLPGCALQLWAPLWADVLVTLWSGPLFLASGAGEAYEQRVKAQRDMTLRAVLSSEDLQRRVVDASREDLRAVREVLRPLIRGPLPMLIEEAEVAGGFSL